MKPIDRGISTLAVALSDYMTVPELKALARLTKSTAPGPKPDLAKHILEFLESDGLRMVWQCLDDLQKAAVAEVVHSTDTAFPTDRFLAKYGRLPSFGTDSRGRIQDQDPTPLRFFFYGRGPQSGVMQEGHSVDEIREFLATHSAAPLPDTVLRLLDDVANRCARAHDRGLARLIECDEESLAALIAHDARTPKHCMRAGERHLLVPAASEAAFRHALREIGYLLAAATQHGAKDRRGNALRGPSAPAGET